MILKLNIILSAIPRGYGGAGAYFDKLVDQRKNTFILCPHNFHFRFIFLNRLLLALQVLILRLVSIILAELKLVNEVLIYHPQTIGFKIASRLIKKSNRCVYYVLDSSFFCKKSYNEHNGMNCLNCLTAYQPFNSCEFFPFKYKDGEYIYFLNVLESNIEKIQFVVQHKGIEALLKRRYIQDVNVVIERMITNDLIKLKNHVSLDLKVKYDFVYHGHKLKAKGYDYCIALAKLLGDYSFFFPFDDDVILGNVTFCTQTWESGLIQTINESSIVLVPSVWTAPVESALIKSMLLGKPVCVFNIENSIAKSLLPHDTYIALTGDLALDANTLTNILSDIKKLNFIAENGKSWANKYVSFEI